jgi:hypothetical protein
MKYTELIPVLINAIKEQQTIINNLQTTVSNQKGKINNLAVLTGRMEKLETLLGVKTKEVASKEN